MKEHRLSKLVLTVGVPGSGKSTLAKKFTSQGFVQVERDLLRMALYGAWYSKGVDEKRITHVHEDQIRTALLAGKDVIVSDTNINPTTREHLIKFGSSFGAEIQVVHVAPYMLLDDLIERNANREEQSKVVPVGVVQQMYTSYREQFPIMAPAYDPLKPDAFLFDIDGTVADMTGVRGAFDWKKVGLDKPHSDVIEVLKILEAAGNKLIGVSGRDEVCRDETKDWLLEYMSGEYVPFMRPEGSQIKDSAVKHDLYHRYIAPYYNVKGVFDDRDQVVRTWRSMGLRCYQVAPGNF